MQKLSKKKTKQADTTEIPPGRGYAYVLDRKVHTTQVVPLDPGYIKVQM